MRLIVVILYALIGLSSGAGVLPDSVNAYVEGFATFRTSLASAQTPLSSVSWSFGSKNIATSTNRTISTDPEYEDRVILHVFTGSLVVQIVAGNESGEYSVSIIPTEGDAAITGFTTLNLYERVCWVTVKANNTKLVEFNDTVRLSCSATGSSLSFLWFNGSVEVTASDRVQITDGGSTLTIASVLRYDQELYTCNVSNPVSSSTDDVLLIVSYGPENINLATSPSAEFHEEGSDVFLTCSADSEPSAQFRYFFNGERVTVIFGTQLKLWDIQMEQSGNYSCQAFNPDTRRITTSQLAKISVSKKPAPGLSSEAIIGIVIVCIAVVAVVVGLVGGVCHKMKS